MNPTEFAVTRFVNRNGVTSWRVTGWLSGVRVRRNFKTREDAAAEKAALELKTLQATAGMRCAMTLLADGQLREAEDAFRRLEGKPRSLLFYLDYALANHREPQHQKPVRDAVTEYVAEKKRQHERTLLSMLQLRNITNELKVLTQQFPHAQLTELTPAVLIPDLERGKPSLKTYNNRRGILSTFFKFALQKEWIVANPVEKTPHHRINHRRGSAVTISAVEAAKLMAHVEAFEGGALVPYFALCLFAGLRPCIRFGEISKLKAASVRLDAGVIHIEPEVSKVRMKRIVMIQPNLAAWLRAYPLESYPILPTNYQDLRRQVFERFQLAHDVLRHTFISMFIAKFRSMGEAALQAGNSESIIRKHYLDLKTAAEAEQFFGILPTKRSKPVATIIERSATPTPELGVAV